MSSFLKIPVICEFWIKFNKPDKEFFYLFFIEICSNKSNNINEF